jgi:hypothetical protein
MDRFPLGGRDRYVPSMASLLDPLGLLPRAGQAVRTSLKVAGWTERQVMGVLRSRLDAGAPLAISAASTVASSPASVQAKMSSLLDSALSQSSAASRQMLFHKILDQIVPDEARIVGALSDGSASPLIHVYGRTRAGLVGEVVLENFSLIGKTANLGLPQLTPTYVSHLLSLGLLETGPEDPVMKAEYEILSADITVLKAIKKAARGPIPARVDRFTLRLSGLGLELWAATSGQA